jgi:hypothetical protein
MIDTLYAKLLCFGSEGSYRTGLTREMMGKKSGKEVEAGRLVDSCVLARCNYQLRKQHVILGNSMGSLLFR